MKRNTIILIALALLIIVGGLVWFLVSRNNQPIQPTQPTNQETLSQTSSTSLLTVIDNNVQIKPVAQEAFLDVQEKADVTEGTQVKTSATGRATLESPDGTTVVDKNSQIVVKEASTKHANSIQLELGNLWAKVKKVFNAGEYFQVETANAVAVVRGTSFGVFYKTGVTVVMVQESKVTVRSWDPKTKQQIGNEVIVNAGQKATIVDGKEPVVTNITDADKRTDWWKFNQQGSAVVAPKPTPTPAPVACTLDAKLCPDGSYVSRVAPSCEFAACPVVVVPPAPSNPNAPRITFVNPQIVHVTGSPNGSTQGNYIFYIYGDNLIGSTSVLLNDIPLQFTVTDSHTIKASVNRQFELGSYDLYVIASTGEKLSLLRAVILQ